MKKLFSLASAILIVIGCVVLVALVAYAAAPVLLGAALLHRGTTIATEAFNIPDWIGWLIFLTLVPSCCFLAVRMFSGKTRKWTAMFLIVIAVLSLLAGVVINHKQDVAHLVAKYQEIRRSFLPVRRIDPKALPWFSPSGQPILFFVRPTTNRLEFYQAYNGAHDPESGIQLQPVTRLIWEEWQAEQERERKAETAKQQAAAERASQEKIQHLQIAAISLQREKEDRIRREQAFLDSLTQSLRSKREHLTAFENGIISDAALQPVHEASSQLDTASRALADAMKTAEGGSPLDLVLLQRSAQAALEFADKVETDIAARRADRERKKQLIKAEAQSGMGGENTVARSRSKQPQATRFSSGDSKNVVVTIRLKNGTGSRIFVTFESPDYRDVWPSPGNAWILEPGEQADLALTGARGEPIFLRAWSQRDPSVHWHGCDCDENGKLKPIAVCGENDPPLRTLTERPSNRNPQ